VKAYGGETPAPGLRAPIYSSSQEIEDRRELHTDPLPDFTVICLDEHDPTTPHY
jgi:hypothetical protein